MLIDTSFNELTGRIIGAAIEVHRQVGPGLLESAYVACLQSELSAWRIRFETQRKVPLVYRGTVVDAAYRADLIVEGMVIVEVKSVDRLLGVHDAQLLTYLRLTNSPVGLLVNFNVPKLTDGVKRILNARYVGPDGESVRTT